MDWDIRNSARTLALASPLPEEKRRLLLVIT